MTHEPIPDSLALPIMGMYGIDRAEAEKRLYLLYESGILGAGSPETPETQMRIDYFMSLDSQESHKLVLLEKTINSCAADSNFVRQYDRLTMTNFSKALRRIRAGERSESLEKQFLQFSEHVKATVFQTLLKNHQS